MVSRRMAGSPVAMAGQTPFTQRNIQENITQNEPRMKPGMSRRGIGATACRLLAALALAAAGAATAVAAEPPAVLVFAAATLKPVLDPLAAGWQGGAPVTVAYGATPALAKQIENGAPADVFFSADTDWMDYLAERRLVRLDTRVDLLGNRLVLIARTGAAPVEIGPGTRLAALVGAGPLAMCNPMHHPAGRYGKASLEHLGLWSAVADKVAIAEDVRVAVAMVGRGDAPLAIAFATDAALDDRVAVIGSFPDDSHPPIVYPVALTAASRNPAAGGFLARLRSPAARAAFERAGYRVLR
jgi:molybdate transport system substrate-binding protein